MRSPGPYGEPQGCKARAASAEEDQMYAYQLQSMAIEHARALRSEATAAGRAASARGSRAGGRSAVAASRARAWLTRRAVHA
jgi:hypothetical protein